VPPPKGEFKKKERKGGVGKKKTVWIYPAYQWALGKMEGEVGDSRMGHENKNNDLAWGRTQKERALPPRGQPKENLGENGTTPDQIKEFGNS